MFSLVQKRRWYYLLSSAVIIPGVIIMLYSLVTTGSLFRLSNQFLGGSQYELQFVAPGATEAAIRQVFVNNGNTDVTVQQVGGADSNRWSVRAGFQEPEVQTAIVNELDQLA